MIVPTATSMKFKFPEFVATPDATIEFAIEEAVVACGGGEWIDDANQTLAIMYYAAHQVQLGIMRAVSPTGQLLSNESIGELSMTYEVPTRSGGIFDYDLTTYGRKYRELAAKNFPAVLTVGSAIRM